jgi:phosphoenolpyruvate carboxylase
MANTDRSDLLYHTYNSLFLRLPFEKINVKGALLSLFADACEEGFRKGKSPAEIIHSFWEIHCEEETPDNRLQLLAYFIRYVERQVVLFDSVEDALFEETHELNGAGSLSYLLNRVNSASLRDQLIQKLQDFTVRLVLTAHPTQFYPGKVLAIIDDLGKEIGNKDLERIRLMLLQLGKTSFVNRKKPTPYDEALSLSWYLEHVFYHALPDIIYRLLTALEQDVATFQHPEVLALGFWPGGDRDGNPFVTAELSRDVTLRLREGILRCYYKDIRQLRRRLTFSGVEERIIAIDARLYATLYQPGSPAIYTSSKELEQELAFVRRILIEQHDGLFLDLLDPFLLKVRIFGFHFASLDIRQDSSVHETVWEAIFQQEHQDYTRATEEERLGMLALAQFPLDEHRFPEGSIVYETIAITRQIAQIQRQNGIKGCHRYIISNCGSVRNVMEVFTLARLALGTEGPGGTFPLDIIPLFETVEDLQEAGEVMRTLYQHPEYKAHLAARGNQQTIMLGFSDGTKDGGYLRANWSIYRAKEILTAISREQGVSVVFFDGRGGPPGRGGGNNASYYAAQGIQIENREIQVTIQGQTISSTYGTKVAACYNIERLFTAGLENHLFGTHGNELTEQDRMLMDELAAAAYESYLQLKKDPQFLPYLEKMTPLQWYGDSNIASRPTKRNAGGRLQLEGLRAIPFVGAWAQMKQNIPGYYGFGAALRQLQEAGRAEELRKLYQDSLFFRTLVENSMQSLAKSNFLVTRYQEKDPEFGLFWKKLEEEYLQSIQQLQWVSGNPTLLSENPGSRRSIALREQIVLPLIAIQQFALQQLRSEGLSKEEQELFRKMALRAMFGIINAARNAA